MKQGRRDKAHRLYAKGFVVEFANPKALLYFAAILPQFLNTNAPMAPQFLIMGLATLALDIIAYSVYALVGAHVAKNVGQPWIVSTLNKAAGSALLLAAFKMTRVAN